MEELINKINDLASKINKAITNLRLDDKAKILEELKKQMLASDFWNNQDKAKAVSEEANYLEKTVNNWYSLIKRITNLKVLAQDKQAKDLEDDLIQDLESIKQDYLQLSQELFFQGKYDNLNVILTINAGAGGDDAQDWAAMLERMYLRFAEQNNWTVNYLSRSIGAEAGIKSATFEIKGVNAYGYLQHEAGVHRLVRLSPFDSDHARHTSFAMVEVLPELIVSDLEVRDEDLKIDTFRASGHGGQSVNTTDSAVRITHLPTGLTAICQNERSQLQNKKQALIHLKSKLEKYHNLANEEEKKKLRGEYTQAAWGNQIRSYVLHPYKMVKDHRTDYESSNPDQILDGHLMPFIKASLENIVAE